MDVCESEQALQKYSKVVTSRPPLVPADKNNGTTRPSRIREVSSRYRSPSPKLTRKASPPSQLVPKRAISAERRQPSTLPSPMSPSTPVHDTSAETQLATSQIVGNRLPEAVWPSTMRSLSVSFQSNMFSLPISKREKPVTIAISDRPLMPSSNVACRNCESLPISRKPTPQRKISPFKGKNISNQSENSKPVDGLHARLVDQHRWPSRTSGNEPSNVTTKALNLPLPGIGTPSLRRMSVSNDKSKPLQKAASDAAKIVERMGLVTPVIRSQSLPIPGSRLPSPNRTLMSSSVSRGFSPSRTRALNLAPTRGVNPSRIRPSSPSRQSNSSTSVLSFIADIRKGKKGTNHIEDAHQLRLLYNTHLQWRYANARADATVYNQKVIAEKTLYNVWRTTSELWDSVSEKRIDLQQLRLKLKLYLILNKQVAYLDHWSSIERDHTISLSRAIEDLQASTLRLPVTGGARADIETVKAAVCSAVDVMQAMGSSVCSILSQVEGMNCLVSELAHVAAQERSMLDECEALLAATSYMQVEEYSLRTNLIQF